MRIEVTRGGRIESTHAVDLAVVDGRGVAVATAGDPTTVAYARSALKPFQALPLVQDGVADRFGFGSEELALCCASHSGEPQHVALARRILDRLGLEEEALACGPHAPFSGAAVRALHAAGEAPGRVHNNCSGKHGGMLALALAHGWATEGYHRLEHGVQQRILDEVERWTGLDRSTIGVGVDGCGVATFALPLDALARAFARLAVAAGEAGSAAATVVDAMTAHPFLVGGSKRLCTAIMDSTGGRILAKVGAEGVYGAAARDRGWGIALKVRDGARRAAEVALVALLDDLELLEAKERTALERWHPKRVLNTRGEAVGQMRATMEWRDAG